MSVLIPPMVAVALAFLTGASAAGAGEICIRCTGPEQTYRCAVLGEGVPNDLRRQGFYCAARIARDEDHATCAAVRRETQCQGARRSYVYDPDAPEPAGFAGLEEPQPDAEAVAPGDEDGPPDTVVDLTRETARQTEEGLKEAADQTVETTRGIGEQVQDAAEGAASAVDRAARDTIRCIGSLFNDC